MELLGICLIQGKNKMVQIQTEVIARVMLLLFHFRKTQTLTPRRQSPCFSSTRSGFDPKVVKQRCSWTPSRNEAQS